MALQLEKLKEVELLEIQMLKVLIGTTILGTKEEFLYIMKKNNIWALLKKKD